MAIAVSILSANLACLGQETTDVLQAGASRVHFDVMDNHYVPNLTFGPDICQALRSYGITAPIDVHLMVQPVDGLITAFAKAGASSIIFHLDASTDPVKSIQLIKSYTCQVGIAVNPQESLTVITEAILPQIDMILLMSVNPGFAGQKFIPTVLDKLKAARQLIDSMAGNANISKIKLAIDGGVNLANIGNLAEAGADILISGSGIFSYSDYHDIIKKMINKIQQ